MNSLQPIQMRRLGHPVKLDGSITLFDSATGEFSVLFPAGVGTKTFKPRNSTARNEVVERIQDSTYPERNRPGELIWLVL